MMMWGMTASYAEGARLIRSGAGGDCLHVQYLSNMFTNSCEAPRPTMRLLSYSIDRSSSFGAVTADGQGYSTSVDG